MENRRKPSAQARYRVEHGERCVDVKVSSIEQVFDNRDPAPFRRRDLDPELVEYLCDAGEDLAGEKSIRVVFWLASPPRPNDIEEAFRAHFDYLIERIRRTRLQRRRTGQVALVIGVILLMVLLALAQMLSGEVPGALRAGLREGLLILGWVVMWRPVEALLYDWIPLRHELDVVSKLFAAAVEVRVERGPEVPGTDGAALGRTDVRC